MSELNKEELDDDYSINLWLYYKDMDYNQVIKYAKEYYDNIQKADETNIINEDTMI